MRFLCVSYAFPSALFASPLPSLDLPYTTGFSDLRGHVFNIAAMFFPRPCFGGKSPTGHPSLESLSGQAAPCSNVGQRCRGRRRCRRFSALPSRPLAPPRRRRPNALRRVRIRPSGRPRRSARGRWARRRARRGQSEEEEEEEEEEEGVREKEKG